MNCFHQFTAPLWELFTGNLLLFGCSLFYLAWWLVSFRPGVSKSAGGAVFLAFAFLCGIAAVLLLGLGLNSLSGVSKGLPVRYIFIGAFVLYFILLAVTAFCFQRQVTSELLLMLLWAALELAIVAVLTGTGRFGAGRAAVMTALIALATAAGLVCYVLYYRLSGLPSYWDGMVPLISDAAVMAVFSGVLALS